MGFFSKLKEGLSKTKENLIGKIDKMLAGFGVVDDDLLDELEEILITSDFGVETTEYIIDCLRDEIKSQKLTKPEEVKGKLQEIICGILTQGKLCGIDTNAVPCVVSVIGVNGVGKTTSIGKLANIYKKNGRKVLLAAGDTFRAAAIDQLEIWAQRVGVDIIKQNEGSDPAAVLFDACRAAKARDVDVLICDTAGRLHNKKNLMAELSKMSRVVEKEMSEAKREIFLVLDATTGQNAVSQAKAFSEVADISGIILTKLDGTSKGGIIVSICKEMGIPVRLVGVGEGIDDMQSFSAEEFVKAIFE
ncbi:MAG: signal recognition particle-docking protein FtsY [Ruminococcaceae bacterium]|nr:signal recognition particle-docking protein FtsY [Oscillospiraceae bacterium]